MDNDEEGLFNGVEARERYEALLAEADATDLSDVAESGLLNIKGRDSLGRPVVVLLPCRLPLKNATDALHRVLLFCLRSMEHVVLSEYSLVVSMLGMTKQQRPSLKWLRFVYEIIGRPFKKNVKTIFLIHPSGFVKLVLTAAKPFLSSKVYSKIHRVTSIPEMYKYISPDNLFLPSEVFTHCRKGQRFSLFGVTVSEALASNAPPEGSPPLPLFLGLLLASLMERAPLVEGVLRVPGGTAAISDLKLRLERGAPVDWSLVPVHDAAGILKLWLRELRVAVVDSAHFQGLAEAQDAAWQFLEESAQIPRCNLELLRALVEFCRRIAANEEHNKMGVKNISVILGPVVLASASADPLAAVRDIQRKSAIFQKLLEQQG